MTSGRFTTRVTAWVIMTISSIVTGSVESWPITTMAALSPTSSRSTPAASASRALGASYAVTMTTFSPRCFICARSVSEIVRAASADMACLLRVEHCR